MLLGLAAALLASLLFNIGIVLQAIDARTAPRALGLRWALLRRLVRRRIWVAGWVLGMLGIWPQVVSYAYAPFVVVQPALAAGLLLVLVLGVRLLHERVGVAEIAGVTGIIAGVALVSWGSPAHVEAQRGMPAVVAVVAALSLAGLAPYVLRGTRVDNGITLAIACGCGFAATNVATKIVGDEINAGHPWTAAAWGAVVLADGVMATLVSMTAFQRIAAMIVVPVSTAVQMFLPIVVEPFFLQEHWGSAPYDGGPVFAGLVLTCVGSVAVSASHTVSDLFARAS